ncbi:uncharacterized protein DUF4372 [Paenibacillus taihuensis]|uniref:Uncharacterized protein DUF4372 n=1 Tax=Paenibacillus taihuensis TaxID=1156355 RepID=A0A3D9RR96_9BACL|nr:DUF4372 domain-containing protein [Paenibacillus taihuensis]REE77733.1 uncharacterized protein DUF4372 [Paenibacillus taihuensis]
MVNGFRQYVQKRVTDQIAQSGQDKCVKKLTTTAYFKLFLHAQLHNCDGLRDIANHMLSRAFQKELGLSSISASQLSRKHNQVDSELLKQVFERLVKQMLMRHAPANHRKNMKIIDSSTVSLCLNTYKWAAFRKSKAGIKLLLRLAFVGENEVLPERATITEAKKNDRAQMDGSWMNLVQRTYLTAVM